MHRSPWVNVAQGKTVKACFQSVSEQCLQGMLRHVVSTRQIYVWMDNLGKKSRCLRPIPFFLFPPIVILPEKERRTDRTSRYLNCRTYIPAEASEWLGLASQIGDAEWTERVYQEAYKASPTPN
ncbi:uncharacterized protein LOC112495091 isoform X1 [Cephus cinctus]|uniref:Uncharacterized protein LOC112495091 isoform X1 n=1 Tax=Cephus cinctus TaxID=211228 RepID=A0AAJ7RSD8_CEPCN|nr:uncharacterized protein LOC112495091 isoform X1 [Cephus cinctus]